MIDVEIKGKSDLSAGDRKKLVIDLYKIIVDEIHRYHALHQQRTAFFSGLIVSLLAATVVGVYKADHWSHYLFLTIGPVFIVMISVVAMRGIYGIYRLFLESVTTRAKLEHYMGFADPPFPESNVNVVPLDIVPLELDIVPLRHQIHRRECSREDKLSNGGETQYGKLELINRWIKKLLGENSNLDDKLKESPEGRWLYYFLHQGFQRWTNLYFFWILVIGLALVVATITLAAYSWVSSLVSVQ